MIRKLLWVVLINLMLFVAYRQGVLNERKHWQYCDWNIAEEGRP